jgi:hypothetical protein
MNYLTEIPWWHYPIMFMVYSFLSGFVFIVGVFVWVVWTNKKIHLIKNEDDNRI